MPEALGWMMFIVVDSGGSARQRLYDAATGWCADDRRGPQDLIDAACAALVDGLDAPALRELAGASGRDPSWHIRELTAATLEQLHIPASGSLPPGRTVAAGGGTTRRAATDTLHLTVTPAPAQAGGGFQVEVRVNSVEMTSAGAGLGMDPHDLLVPTNRLLAAIVPHTVGIARCECGVYGCGSTDVTIVRDGDAVHWDWSIEVPMNRGVTFDAAAYDAETTRIAADHSWETPQYTAGRLILTRADRDRLAAHGLALSWAANNHRNPSLFRVALQIGADYQVFLDTPWHDRNPDELAHQVCTTLARPPKEWTATWHPLTPRATTPPAIAGRNWRRQE